MARVRRTFTSELKRDAVALVEREGKTVSEVARNLGIARSLLQRWIDQTRDQERNGSPRKARAARDRGSPTAA
jgi:transposase